MEDLRYRKQIKKIIYDTIKNFLNKQMSCSIRSLGQNSDNENIQVMIKQILSNEDIILKEEEVVAIIIATSERIKEKKSQEFPLNEASKLQVTKFAKQISNETSLYFSRKHVNTINIPLINLPNAILKYLANNKISDLKFVHTKNRIKMVITANGPMVAGGSNIVVENLNHFIQAILSVGLLQNIFKLNLYSINNKIFDLGKSSFGKKEKFIKIDNFFSAESEYILNKVSLGKNTTLDDIALYFDTLSTIFNHSFENDDLTYSLSWYCKSLVDNDIKTKFISCYISFEALSAIWTKKGPNEKGSQDHLKYTIPALLATSVNDLKDKQDLINKLIKLRNQLFHGDKKDMKSKKNEDSIQLSLKYLQDIYKKLFVYTIGKF